MKKLYFYLFFVFLLITNLSAQQDWFWQNPLPQGNNLNDVMVLDKNLVFAVGDASTFIKSTDSGLNWTIKFNIANTAHQIRSVYFSDQQNGFAVAYDNAGDLYHGWLFKTTNGGNEWSSQTFDFNLCKIFFIDKTNGWLIGNVFGTSFQGKILKTTDGGNNWLPSDFTIETELFSVDFTDELNGWIVGKNVVLNTSDGGITWEVINQDSLTFWSVDFINQQKGWACGESFIVKTTDGGISWSQQNFDENLLFTSIKFIDELHGFAVSKSWLHPDIRPVILMTSNGGASWDSSGNENNSDLFSISALNLSNIVAVGQGGTIIKSSDGLNWEMLSTGNNDIYFHDIDFVNKDIGWILGYNYQFDILYKTTDSGNTWAEVYRDQLTNNEYSNKLFFINKYIGWAVRSGKILKTTNGGVDWDLQYNSTYYLHDIIFKDSLIGLAVGTGLLKTTDGGINWENKTSPIQRITGIKISSPDTIFIVGYGRSSNGFIYKSTDFGNNWIFNYTSGFRLLNIFMLDKLNYWASGTSSNFLQTNNGGMSWTVNTFPTIDGYVTSIFFINRNIGWILRDGGLFLKTIDGCANWNSSSMRYPIANDLFFMDENVGWMCGGNASILHTTNGGITFIDNKNPSPPKDFYLKQNYPNPFNPSTKIEYSIPKQSHVIIKVFDLLGREVTTLVNEDKPAGNYNVEFIGSNLPSGIYFYRMEAGNYSSTKKLLLLK